MLGTDSDITLRQTKQQQHDWNDTSILDTESRIILKKNSNLKNNIQLCLDSGKTVLVVFTVVGEKHFYLFKDSSIHSASWIHDMSFKNSE